MRTIDVYSFLSFSPFVLLFCVGVVGEIMLYKNTRRKEEADILLKEDGILTTGVLEVCRVRAREIDLTFSYEVQGKKYRRIQHTPLGTQMTTIGGAVTVCYDSQRPERARLRDGDAIHSTALHFLMVIFVMLLALGLVILVGYLTMVALIFFPAS
jgi:hypothetical protein